MLNPLINSIAYLFTTLLLDNKEDQNDSSLMWQI